jgi:hypothetical protein
MSQTRSISLLTRDKGVPVPVSQPVVNTGSLSPEIDQVFLENPTPETLKSYRSSQWKVAFETFNVVATTNGLRSHHFVRLEREVPFSSTAH